MTPTAYQSLAGGQRQPRALLGRHVGDGAGQPRLRAARALARQLGDQAEVEDLTTPSRVTSTLDGFRSRCSMPAFVERDDAARQLQERRAQARHVERLERADRTRLDGARGLRLARRRALGRRR